MSTKTRNTRNRKEIDMPDPGVIICELVVDTCVMRQTNLAYINGICTVSRAKVHVHGPFAF